MKLETYQGKDKMDDKKQIRLVYDRLTYGLNEFSDIIPTESVHSGSKNNKYKCRKAWWCVLRDEVDALQEVNALSDEFEKRFQSLWIDYRSTVDKEEYGVKPEQIQQANSLIRNILSDLEVRLK